MRAPVNAYAFSLARIGCGIYGIYFFWCMSVFPPDLLADQKLFFLQILPWSPEGSLFQALMWLGGGASLMLFLGIWRRWWALIFWLCMVTALNRNYLLREIHFDYLGWMLLLFLFVPGGEPWALRPRAVRGWSLPREFYVAVLICFGASYSFSGITKLASPEWMSGSTLAAFHRLGFASGSGGGAGEALAVGLAEALALPLILHWRTRPWIWLVLTVFQAFLLITTRIGHISFVMVLFHLLLIHEDWRKRP